MEFPAPRFISSSFQLSAPPKKGWRALCGPKHSNSEEKKEPLRDSLGADLAPFRKTLRNVVGRTIQTYIDGYTQSGFADREAANPMNPSKEDRQSRILLNSMIPRQILQIDGHMPQALTFDIIVENNLLCMTVLPLYNALVFTTELCDQGKRMVIQHSGTEFANAVGQQHIHNKHASLVMFIDRKENVKWVGDMMSRTLEGKFRFKEDACRFWDLVWRARFGAAKHGITKNDLESHEYVAVREDEN